MLEQNPQKNDIDESVSSIDSNEKTIENGEESKKDSLEDNLLQDTQNESLKASLDDVKDSNSVTPDILEEEQIHFLPHDHYQHQLFEIQKTYTMDGFRKGAVDVRIIDFHERSKILGDLFYKKSIYDLIKNNCFPLDFSIKSYKFDTEKKGWEYVVYVKFEDYRKSMKDSEQVSSDNVESVSNTEEEICSNEHQHDEHCGHSKKKKLSNIEESKTDENIYDSDDEAFSAKADTVETVLNSNEIENNKNENSPKVDKIPEKETDTWDNL